MIPSLCRLTIFNITKKGITKNKQGRIITLVVIFINPAQGDRKNAITAKPTRFPVKKVRPFGCRFNPELKIYRIFF